MNRIKIAIAGTGMAWEKLHAPAFARLQEKFEIFAVCNRSIEEAYSVAEYLNLDKSRVYQHYEEMFAIKELEAAALMLPIEENYEAAKAAIQKGLHIFAEKPFSSTSKAADELCRLVRERGVKALVGENFRYTEENRLIKKLIADNVIGDTMYFIDNHIKDFGEEMRGDSFSAKEWRQHPQFSGGIFLDSGVHHIARLRYFFGSCVKAAASGRPTSADYCPYSCITALLTFGKVSGFYGFFCEGKETQAPLIGLRIFGTLGEIYLEEKDCGFVNLSLKDGSHQAIPYKPEEGYYHELENFYNAVRNNVEIISTPEKELGDIQVIEAILEACAVFR